MTCRFQIMRAACFAHSNRATVRCKASSTVTSGRIGGGKQLRHCFSVAASAAVEEYPVDSLMPTAYKRVYTDFTLYKVKLRLVSKYTKQDVCFHSKYEFSWPHWAGQGGGCLQGNNPIYVVCNVCFRRERVLYGMEVVL